MHFDSLENSQFTSIQNMTRFKTKKIFSNESCDELKSISSDGFSENNLISYSKNDVRKMIGFIKSSESESSHCADDRQSLNDFTEFKKSKKSFFSKGSLKFEKISSDSEIDYDLISSNEIIIENSNILKRKFQISNEKLKKRQIKILKIFSKKKNENKFKTKRNKRFIDDNLWRIKNTLIDVLI